SDLADPLLKKSPWERPASARAVGRILREISRNRTVPPVIKSPARSPASFRIQPRFAGRDNELEDLMDSLDAPETFQVMLVTGRSGIGKSRLLTEGLKESMVRGSRRTVIRWNLAGQPFGAGRSGIFDQIAEQIETHRDALGDFRELLPEIAPMHPAFRRFDTSAQEFTDRDARTSRKYKIRYLTAIVAALTRHIPWHIVWEDIHTADPFQFEFLKDLVDFSRFQEIHCTFWASIRDDDFSSADDFNQTIRMFKPAKQFRRIQLEPLSPEDSARVVASLVNHPDDAVAVERIAALCQGIPSVIVQTINTWVEQGDLVESGESLRFAHATHSRDTLAPMELEELIRQQLDRLPENERELLTWIAALDDDAYLAVLRYVLECSERDLMTMLNDLIFKNLIISQTDSRGERYAVAGPLIRRVLIRDEDPETLRNLHLDIVTILEDLHGNFAAPERIAWHLEQAGENIAACKHYYTAASNALKVDQIYTARDIIERARKLLPKLGAPRSRRNRLLKARILILGDDVFRRLGSLEHRRSINTRLAELLPSIREHALLREIIGTLTLFAIASYDFDAADRYLTQMEMFNEDNVTRPDTTYFDARAHYHFYKQEFEKARDYLKNGLLIRKSLNTPVVSLASHIGMIAKTYTATGDLDTSAAMLQNTLERLPPDKAVPDRAFLLSEMGNVEIYRENFEKAREYLNRSHDMHRNMGAEYHRACNLHDIGLSHYLEADYIRALDYVRQAFDLLMTLKVPRECLMGAMSLIHIEIALGHYGDAAGIFQRVSDTFTGKTCMTMNHLLVCQYYRVLCRIAPPVKLREYLSTLIGHLRRKDMTGFHEEIRYLVINHLI
ncbi:MAG TPA: tetratricopeptide repeat protein, partial [bacterium]|nr:tetratricopeptide repeat protein [bacterium]